MADLILELRHEIPLGQGNVRYESLGYVQQDAHSDVFPRLTMTPRNALRFETRTQIGDYADAVVNPAINHFNTVIDEGRVVTRYFSHEHVMTEVN